MKSRAALAIGACIALFASLDAQGADAPPPPTIAAAPAALVTPAEDAPSDAPGNRAGEPNVRRTVIDDGRARIEELRVRGQLQRVTVEPKGPMPGYEVLTSNGPREFADDPGTSRGSAGKRVWNVLRF